MGTTEMIATANDLNALRQYVGRKLQLYGNDDLAVKVRNVVFDHAPAHDQANRADPRAFCYVQQRDLTIYCSEAIERAAPPLRIGVLLHEIGHLILNAFEEGQESEVDVDTWVLDNFPEAGYTYKDGAYPGPKGKGFVTARNVQHVSPQFALRIHDEFARNGRQGPF